jgi:hypothetical protein
MLLVEVPRGWCGRRLFVLRVQLQFPHPGRYSWHSTRRRKLVGVDHRANDRMPKAGTRPRLDAHVLNGRIMI